MSKKSAKSKGYRHYKKEKPFLTKKELYALIAIVAVILVAFVLFITYDDGALKIENNAIQGIESNWIVANGGTVSAPRYFKLGELGELEGYELSTSMSYNDYKVNDLYYFPTDEENPVEYISISTASIKNSSAADMGATVIESLSGMDGYKISTPLTEAKVGDTPYSYYSFNTAIYVEPEEVAEEVAEETAEAAEDAAEETAEAAEETAEAPAEEAVEAPAGETAEAVEEAAEETVEEEKAPNTFGQSMNAYVETAHDSCLLVHVVNETKSEEDFLSDDELKAILEKALAAITLEKK